MPKRDQYFDFVKLVAMFMVVLSHVLQVVQDKTQTVYCSNFIVGMNMPLFFLLSGYFSRRMVKSIDWRKYRLRLVRYFWPVLVFALIGWGILLFTKEELSAYYVCSRFFLCVFRGWFFYALAACELITLFIMWLSRHHRIPVWIGMIAAWLLLLMLPTGIWHVKELIAVIPFFFVGACLPKIERWRSVKRIGLICLLAYLLAVFCLGNFWQNGLAFYGHRFFLLRPNWHEFGLMLARYVLGAIGCLMALGVLRCVCDHAPIVLRLAWLGQVTLGVYFVHFLAIKFLYAVIPWTMCMVHVFLVAGCVYLGSSLAVYCTQKMKWANLLFWGPEFR